MWAIEDGVKCSSFNNIIDYGVLQPFNRQKKGFAYLRLYSTKAGVSLPAHKPFIT